MGECLATLDMSAHGRDYVRVFYLFVQIADERAPRNMQ